MKLNNCHFYELIETESQRNSAIFGTVFRWPLPMGRSIITNALAVDSLAENVAKRGEDRT